jgi:uncharacterized membrane protein YhaH (DUF805 family)
MIKSYQRFWHNLFNFSGVSSRSDYWWPVIINYIIGGILITIVQAALGHPIQDIYSWSDLGISTISKLIAFIVWLGTLSLQFRRLHDTDRSGWWVLLPILPIIGTIWYFILMILPSKPSRWR